MEGPRQFLLFSLGTEHYGIDIMHVQEIRGWTTVAKIPKAASQVLGVLNLRGSIVPVVDLGICLGLDGSDITPLTVIIVLSLMSGRAKHELGLVVDAVSDVINIESGQLQEPPPLGFSRGSDFVEALAVVDHRLLVLLDAGSLLRRAVEPLNVPTLDSVA